MFFAFICFGIVVCFVVVPMFEFVVVNVSVLLGLGALS